MKKRIKYLYLSTSMKVVLTAALVMAQASCASHKEPNELLQEAHRYHVEAVTTQAEVEQLLGTLRSTGRGSEADSLAGVLEDWEEGLVEVPGFEHEHHHEGHEGHHHDHKPAPQMTDASLLDYQKSTLQAIQELKKDVEGRLAAPN